MKKKYVMLIDDRRNASLEIELYLHCSECLKDLPETIAPRTWQDVEAGLTKDGVQIWCKRHNCNIALITPFHAPILSPSGE